ncbi:hypothetical protein [Allohahella marinimesophila]|uniref:Uncharacterized protein n=1 Tax=Allohahella marinimesophila TaxID=1054972 RepID=A0ABP7Q7F8_9GAMM
MIKRAADELDGMLIALIVVATVLFFAVAAMFMTDPEVKLIQELRLLNAPGAHVEWAYVESYNKRLVEVLIIDMDSAAFESFPPFSRYYPAALLTYPTAGINLEDFNQAVRYDINTALSGSNHTSGYLARGEIAEALLAERQEKGSGTLLNNRLMVIVLPWLTYLLLVCLAVYFARKLVLNPHSSAKLFLCYLPIYYALITLLQSMITAPQESLQPLLDSWLNH